MESRFLNCLKRREMTVGGDTRNLLFSCIVRTKTKQFKYVTIYKT